MARGRRNQEIGKGYTDFASCAGRTRRPRMENPRGAGARGQGGHSCGRITGFERPSVNPGSGRRRPGPVRYIPARREAAGRSFTAAWCGRPAHAPQQIPFRPPVVESGSSALAEMDAGVMSVSALRPSIGGRERRVGPKNGTGAALPLKKKSKGRPDAFGPPLLLVRGSLLDSGRAGERPGTRASSRAAGRATRWPRRPAPRCGCARSP